MEFEDMVARILDAYDRSSASDMAEGERWYETARITAAALAAGTNISAEQAAGVIAALSPRVRWENNVRSAAEIISAARRDPDEKPPSVAGFYRNVEKAWRIATGWAPENVLGGPKVTNFYRNICGDEDSVTVDVWSARLAEGYSDPRAPQGKRYAKIADAFRMAADARNVSPMVMQATTWVFIRRTYGIGDQLMFDWENERF
jgi:hypothetical protein